MADDGTTEVTVKTAPRRRKRAPMTEEAKQAKREGDKNRGRTRVNLGLAFNRWRELRNLRGFKSDIHLAFFLLDQ